MDRKCQNIHFNNTYILCKSSDAVAIKINGILAIYFGTVETAIFFSGPTKTIQTMIFAAYGVL